MAFIDAQLVVQELSAMICQFRPPSTSIDAVRPSHGALLQRPRPQPSDADVDPQGDTGIISGHTRCGVRAVAHARGVARPGLADAPRRPPPSHMPLYWLVTAGRRRPEKWAAARRRTHARHA